MLFDLPNLTDWTLLAVGVCLLLQGVVTGGGKVVQMRGAIARGGAWTESLRPDACRGYRVDGIRVGYQPDPFSCFSLESE